MNSIYYRKKLNETDIGYFKTIDNETGNLKLFFDSKMHNMTKGHVEMISGLNDLEIIEFVEFKSQDFWLAVAKTKEHVEQRNTALEDFLLK